MMNGRTRVTNNEGDGLWDEAFLSSDIADGIQPVFKIGIEIIDIGELNKNIDRSKQ